MRMIITMIMAMVTTGIIIITTITVMGTATGMITTITMMGPTITPPATPGCLTAAPIRRARRSQA
jgi:hypothetical protein